MGASVQTLRPALKSYAVTNDLAALTAAIEELRQLHAGPVAPRADTRQPLAISREDLHLVCYEYLCS